MKGDDEKKKDRSLSQKSSVRFRQIAGSKL